MNAAFKNRLERIAESLIAMSAPSLMREPKPLRPPLATAPLAQTLTLRELAMLARVRNQAVSHA